MPDKVTLFVLVSVVAAPRVSVPAFTVVIPVWVLVLLRVSLPAPVLVSPSVPTPPFCSVPPKVKSVASPTVRVAAVAV